jgi:glycerol 3-phosphatase-2
VGDELVAGYDLVIFDLDGVVYLIDKPIPGAAEAIERGSRRLCDQQRVAAGGGRRRAADRDGCAGQGR